MTKFVVIDYTGGVIADSATDDDIAIITVDLEGVCGDDYEDSRENMQVKLEELASVPSSSSKAFALARSMMNEILEAAKLKDQALDLEWVAALLEQKTETESEVMSDDGRKFFRTTITVDVLSEDEALSDDNLSCVHHAITDGDCVGTISSTSVQISPKRTAELLDEFGSCSDFFMLGFDGEDLFMLGQDGEALITE